MVDKSETEDVNFRHRAKALWVDPRAPLVVSGGKRR